LLDSDELKNDKGVNQILKLARDTFWSSYFSSICNLINMYNVTCSIPEKNIVDGSTYCQHGDVDNAYKILTSFEFILSCI